MAISDEERREAAASLRGMTEEKLRHMFLEEILDCAIGGRCLDDEGNIDERLILNRLADLIEPQSVEPEAVVIYVGPDIREMSVWACPACGEVISYDFDDYNPKTDGPRYCSGCGRKVAKW